MAWEERNGNFYYYKKRRIGNTVVSEYYGSSPLVELLVQETELERERERIKRKEERKLIQKDNQVVQELLAVEELIRALTYSVLLDHGYHAHKGQWRKKRNGR